MAMNFSLNFLKLLPRSPVRTLSYPSQSLTVPLEIPQYLDNPPRSERNIHQSKETIITKLSNGLRVATQESFGQYCTIGGLLVNISHGSILTKQLIMITFVIELMHVYCNYFDSAN